MAGKTKRAALVLTENQKTILKELAGSRTAPAREVERAKVLIGGPSRNPRKFRHSNANFNLQVS